MTRNILIGCLCSIVAGIVIVTLIAWKRPHKLVDELNSFRYGLAGWIIAVWPFSILFVILWSMTWPARKLVAKTQRPNEY